KRSDITEEEIKEVVEKMTGIPLTEKINQSDFEKLLNLETELKKRVIGQDHALSSVARDVRRARSGIRDPRHPLASFLFMGPTGVGKTELVKALAETVFGDETALVQVDMSEYMEAHDISKLIGAPPGYVGYDEPSILEQVRRKKYCVFLMDEIEKADPKIFNILLGIMEEGGIRDGTGRWIDFTNVIVVMTSNVGGSTVSEGASVGFSTSKDTKEKQVDDQYFMAAKNLFRPEFLNRLDEQIVFNQLSDEVLKLILQKEIGLLEKRLESLGYEIAFKPEVLSLLAKAGYSPAYGARPLKRAIQRLIEDELANLLIANDYPKGTKFYVSVSDKKLIFKAGLPPAQIRKVA
ncbi:MAG: ATP-dependent Clp protease ATP-binding subunit, partial [Bdellovibrionales bacterium]|nr:ATP-dependent Clp protease ATP-binding subunit [Bdellovibrionales bacterium]